MGQKSRKRNTFLVREIAHVESSSCIRSRVLGSVFETGLLLESSGRWIIMIGWGFSREI